MLTFLTDQQLVCRSGNPWRRLSCPQHLRWVIVIISAILIIFIVIMIFSVILIIFIIIPIFSSFLCHCRGFTIKVALERERASPSSSEGFAFLGMNWFLCYNLQLKNIPSLCFHCVPFIAHQYHEDAQGPKAMDYFRKSRYQVAWKLLRDWNHKTKHWNDWTDGEWNWLYALSTQQAVNLKASKGSLIWN